MGLGSRLGAEAATAATSGGMANAGSSIGVDRAVGDEQHAERLLRAVQRQPRRLRPALRQPTPPAARAARSAGCRCRRCRSSRASRNAPSRTSRARTLRLDDAAARDDRQIRIGGRDRGLPADVLGAGLGDTGFASSACAVRAQRAGAYSGIRTSRLAATWFCGVTVAPSNSTPSLSVVVVTLPLTCRRDADRASMQQPLGAQDSRRGDRRRRVLLCRARGSPRRRSRARSAPAAAPSDAAEARASSAITIAALKRCAQPCRGAAQQGRASPRRPTHLRSRCSLPRS